MERTNVKKYKIGVFVTLTVLLLAIVYYAIAPRKIRDVYVCNLPTVYYDPYQGEDIHSSFAITNDFSKEPLSLELLSRTCSCVSVNVSQNKLDFEETAHIDVVFRTDVSVHNRNEQVIFNTSSPKLPAVRFITKVNTIPFLRIEVPDKKIPLLNPGESHTSSVKAFAYVNGKEEADDVRLSVEGIGLSLNKMKRSVRKVDDVFEVTFDSILTFEYNDWTNYRSRNDGLITLSNRKYQVHSDISWIPVVPFRIEPDIVFISSSKSKEVTLTFEYPAQIIEVHSGDHSVLATLTSPPNGSNHTIKVEYKPEGDDAPDAVELLIKTNRESFSNIRIPVCILK